jgi:hypothetical protein
MNRAKESVRNPHIGAKAMWEILCGCNNYEHFACQKASIIFGVAG